MRLPRPRRSAAVVAAAAGLVWAVQPALAHVGSLGTAVQNPQVPSWLMVLTGGGIVGVSFLFTSFVTDHEIIRRINRRGLALPAPATVRTAARWTVRLVAVAVLALIVVTGLVGPQSATANFAILVVWAGWWAGYTISVYAVGNTWPALNPWRTVAELLPRIDDATYPERFGSWPSVVGLLGLVWLEVVSPVAENARLLVGFVLLYTVVTLTGASVYGAGTWFERVDPIARVFRWYGRAAPVQFGREGVSLTLPGTALVEGTEPRGEGEAAFVVALLWATTYDGLVSTPAWTTLADAVVGTGVPALLVYLVAMAVGFVVFLWVYRRAAAWSRRTADSYVSASFVRRWFVPALIPIAVGYHVAHFLGYFLTLSPALAAVAAAPFAPPANLQALVLPDWFGTLQLAFVVLGHLLAVWLSHALAFEVFPGRLQPIRSQYPFVFAMVFYTMISLWIVSQPFTEPPYV
ncbi:hypothetical protein BRC83_02695 [Halobacteriales archaeon QS_1_68_17]|nr:MAG: hypothetical protein BRC83_02695 [Halobacteriales archaeon QS_1_68_17]